MMKRLTLAILLLTALAAGAFLALTWPAAEASPDVTITVNSTDDSDVRDEVLTLREAMLLATGDLSLSELDEGECDQVEGAGWMNGLSWDPWDCESTTPPGPESADTIVFDPSVFPPGPSTVITLVSGALPQLDTGEDTVDGSSADVIVDGGDQFNCFEITSDSNTIKALEVVNCLSGVYIDGAKNNTIGGSLLTGNIIDFSLVGVSITGSGASDNSILGNRIRFNARGIRISEGAHSNTIRGNVVSASTESDGVSIWGSGTDGNEVKGNWIGTDFEGIELPNEARGVGIGDGAQGNVVGGTDPDEANTIAFNKEAGVFVQEGALYNTIRGNSIYSNGGKGIELASGGNAELEPPTVDSVGSVFGTACPNCTIDIYSDDEDEGRVYEGSTTADADGNWSFSGTPEGPNITATATDGDGNTSEFSQPLEPPSPGQMQNCPQEDRWAISVWAGEDLTDTEQALATCGAGTVAAAYGLDPDTQEWLRWFADRPEVSSLTTLDSMMGVMTLGAASASQTTGRIAFSSARDGDSEIYVMNADGSGQTNITTNSEANDERPAWSPDGSRIAFTSDRDGDWEIYVMNADGTGQTNVTKDPYYDSYADWSPDGSQIVFMSNRDGHAQIFVMNANGTDPVNISNSAAGDWFPAWSPDGSKIAFTAQRDVNDEIYVMNTDGTDQTNLTNNPAGDFHPAWSPDGSKIAFASTRDDNGTGTADIYVMNIDGTGVVRLTNDPATDWLPAWSSDGSQIAFVSERDGNDEIYVMNADGTGETNLTNNAGIDNDPAWSP